MARLLAVGNSRWRVAERGPWLVLGSAIAVAAFLAISLVIYARVLDLRDEAKSLHRLADEMTARRSSEEELARTRYETLIAAVRDLKRAEDLFFATYQDDVRRGLASHQQQKGIRP